MRTPAPSPAPTAPSRLPRLIAGALGVAAALAAVSRMGVTSVDRAAPGPRPAPRRAPASVLRHPDPARPLMERWEWARTEARRLGMREVWIGYHVRRSLLVDFRGLALPDPRLADLVGPGEAPDDLAMLFRFAPGGRRAGAALELTRVHAGGFLAPVDLGGVALLWLGAGDDGTSLARLDTLFADARTAGLREDLVAAVGLHGSSAAVVPLLRSWSAGTEPDNVRAEAARWLRHHGRPARARGVLPGASARNVLDRTRGRGMVDTTNDFVL